MSRTRTQVPRHHSASRRQRRVNLNVRPFKVPHTLPRYEWTRGRIALAVILNVVVLALGLAHVARTSKVFDDALEHPYRLR